ncbi:MULTISPECIES: hypothetical protein [Flavobacterium]|uniref:Uncharacterized protein n=1 Tax=Flavobacterium nitrogenifigens TaxID=1617283 RepID=A0A521EC83_9FLAO|nr:MULTISPECIES: hypothetical protein [Flavobacterium]WDF62977.1 hypothetical protein PQ463_15260 [Flavobacterium sp. KACC 22763]SMO81081.1 hypothetical protein SAMN06265220_10448 [Flavobacterium nitrogenifigens]
MKKPLALFYIPLLALMTGCNGQVKKEEKEALAKQPGNVVKTAIGDITLPAPYAIESKSNVTKVTVLPMGNFEAPNSNSKKILNT